jgi:hypothetical protein
MGGERKRVSWKILHGTVICVHSQEAPTDRDWEAHLRAVRDEPRVASILVFTYGGAPNATQRAALNDVLQRVRVPIAIMTPSLLARGAGTALRWFNPKMRIFDPEDLEGALDHLALSQPARDEISTALGELKREVAPHEIR